MLDIARIESGHLSLSVETFPLQAVVADCVEAIRPLAAQAGVTVATHGAATVVADRQRTKQVVLNLLSNAVKYNAGDRRITVAVERVDPARARLAVTDTGMGIPAADLDRLFQPFERLGAGATDIEGTGVGLALTRAMVEAMGGTIGVASARGRGSTFWVELDAVVDEPAPDTADGLLLDGMPLDGPAASTPHPAPLDDTRPVVLYVDDDRAALEAVERLFRSRPERLVTAMQGAAARELARAVRPVVMLVDLDLPDIGGEDLVRLLRADPATRPTPVVVVAADLARDRALSLGALGVEHHLPKPFDGDHLAAVLDALAAPAAGPR